jgi:hypothetical protein
MIATRRNRLSRKWLSSRGVCNGGGYRFVCGGIVAQLTKNVSPPGSDRTIGTKGQRMLLPDGHCASVNRITKDLYFGKLQKVTADQLHADVPPDLIYIEGD